MNSSKNHLKDEKSPYLLQHAGNPVDWYPWDNKAFNLAKEKNKPIFLSIGYSTCHWCHVMAHESFEDIKVATLLNENFICIKVDKEERPDVDKIYMNVCQILTGRGGWPLTIIMTPDKKPFFAATYIPKETRYGTKGLLSIIPEIINLWKNKNTDILKSASKITDLLQNIKKSNQIKQMNIKPLDSAYNQLFNSFDELFGGFGNAPKFPKPHNLLFLLRYWRRTGNKYSMKIVLNTLKQMRMGGIYDQIGFGFHRYSTDSKWLLPHFEKMLYDQALLIMAYTEAYQATKISFFKKTAQEVIEYVIRDMMSEEGGFYSAEDADSEGKEGKFYTWEFMELKQILTKEELDLVTKFYNIKINGNFSDEIGNNVNKNIFYQKMNVEDFSKFYKIEENELLDRLELIRKKLFKIRNNRIHPYKDDKILTDWNGLMIAALAKAAQVFDNNSYVIIAEKCLNFLLKNMLKNKGELLHRYRRGEAKIPGFADDYAFLIFGLIELYQATFTTKYLQILLDLNKYLIDNFWDKNYGGIFFTSDLNEKLITRSKDIYDGALPSANSISMYNFIRIARITGNIDFEKKAMQISDNFSNEINKMPGEYTQMMISLDFSIGPSFEIVIVGSKDCKETQKIIKTINSIYLPKKVIILKEPNVNESIILENAPYIKEYSQIKNKVTVYVCKNQQCQIPTTSIEKMKQLLKYN